MVFQERAETSQSQGGDFIFFPPFRAGARKKISVVAIVFKAGSELAKIVK